MCVRWPEQAKMARLLTTPPLPLSPRVRPTPLLPYQCPSPSRAEFVRRVLTYARLAGVPAVRRRPHVFLDDDSDDSY